MSRNGSGTMSVPYDDFVSGTTISSTQMDANFADVVAEITNSIACDGQSTVTADIPMGTNKITGLKTGTLSTDAANLGQVQAQAYIWCGTAGGTKNALTLTAAPAITSYAAGQVFRFIAGGTDSDDAVTVNVNSVGNKAIQNNGAALDADTYIESGKLYEIVYDGTQFQISKMNLTNGEFVSTAMKAVTDATSLAEGRTAFGLEIGADVQAYDDELAAIAGLTSAANKVPYFTGSGTADLLDFKDEDDMASDSATAVSSQQSIKAYVDSLTFGDTWTPYASPARQLGVEYTNSSGRPIQVEVTAQNNGTGNQNYLTLTIDGVTISSAGISDPVSGTGWVPDKHPVTGIVPNGKTYQVDAAFPAAVTQVLWSELR